MKELTYSPGSEFRKHSKEYPQFRFIEPIARKKYLLEFDENKSNHCDNDYANCLRINNTGDLCPPPHGNFTFSDLPIVKRNRQTDHVSVAWTYQVDQRILKSSAFFVCKLNYSDTIECILAMDS